MIWTELAIQRENGKGRKILGHVLYPSSAFISLTHINSLVAHCIPPLCLALISLHTQLSLFAPLHCSVYQNNYLSALLSAVASREEDDTLRKLEDREGRTPNLIIGILFFSYWNVGPFIDLIFEERNRLVILNKWIFNYWHNCCTRFVSSLALYYILIYEESALCSIKLHYLKVICHFNNFYKTKLNVAPNCFMPLSY